MFRLRAHRPDSPIPPYKTKALRNSLETGGFDSEAEPWWHTETDGVERASFAVQVKQASSEAIIRIKKVDALSASLIQPTLLYDR